MESKFLTSEDRSWIGYDFVVQNLCNIDDEIGEFTSNLGRKGNSVKRGAYAKLKEICSNPNVTNRDIQKKISGYPKSWYECRIFGQTYGKDIRLVYFKERSKKDVNDIFVCLFGLYTHKEVENKHPLRKKGSLMYEGEDEELSIGAKVLPSFDDLAIKEDILNQEDIRHISRFL